MTRTAIATAAAILWGAVAPARAHAQGGPAPAPARGAASTTASTAVSATTLATAPVIAFRGPDEPDPRAAATLRALDAAARRRGGVALDLTPAPPPAPEAASHLRRGIEAYHGFAYDAALGHLDAGVDEIARSGAAGLTPAELSDLLLYRAMALTELGDAARAWEEFVRAAVIDPTRRLDAARFAPRVLEPFARAVAAVAQSPAARLAIVAPIAGCAAHIDARPVGVEPQSVRRGEHYVRLACPGYLPWGARALVADAELTLRPTLTPRPHPDVADARNLARQRGADAVIWAVWTAASPRAPAAGPTLALGLYDVDDGPARGHVITAIGAEPAAAVDTAVDRLLAPLFASRTPRTAPTPWYRSPWLWGAVGAAAAAAILVPLAIERGDPSGFDVRPRGELPP